MSNPTQPNIKLTNSSDYREHYANSVQVRVNVWDFFLVFGTLQLAINVAFLIIAAYSIARWMMNLITNASEALGDQEGTSLAQRAR